MKPWLIALLGWMAAWATVAAQPNDGGGPPPLSNTFGPSVVDDHAIPQSASGQPLPTAFGPYAGNGSLYPPGYNNGYPPSGGYPQSGGYPPSGGYPQSGGYPPSGSGSPNMAPTNGYTPFSSLGGNGSGSSGPGGTAPTTFTNTISPLNAVYNQGGSLGGSSGGGTDINRQAALPPVAMPSSMDMIDNEHKLVPGDRLYYQVLEDRDPPHVLMVDEKGEIDVPYLGERQVGNETLKAMAIALKTELEGSLYYHATVIAAPFSLDRARGQVWVLGSVMHPGPISVPPDDVLTVWSAIWAAGGLSDSANPTRVAVMRNDPNNPKNGTKIEVNIADIYNSGRFDRDVVVQPGDMIMVPSKNEANGFITITGQVRAPGMMALPAGSHLTVSQAILQAGGFTDWGDSDVRVIRYDKNSKRQELTVSVGSVLNEGRRDKDMDLQPGDMVIVDQKWINW